MGIVGFAFGIVGVKVGCKNHIQLTAGRFAQTLYQSGAGGGQVDQRQTLARCQRAHCVGVGTVGRGQGVPLKMAANQRCDQHRQRTLGLCGAGVSQQIGGKLLRRSVAGRVVYFFVVMTELNQQQVTLTQCVLNRSPQPFLTKTLGAAPVAGMVEHCNVGAHIQV